MTYTEWLRDLIKSHDPTIRPKIAERAQKSIQRHYNKTSDPILDTVPHPDSGLTWEFLCRVAFIGDTKMRRNEPSFGRPGTEEYKKQAEKYQQAREALRAGLSESGTRY